MLGTVLLNLLPFCILSLPLGSCPNLPFPPPFFRHYPSLGKISTEYQTTSPLPPTQIVVSESLLASGQIFTHPYPFLEAMSTQGPKALLRSSVPAAHLLEPNPYPLLHMPCQPLGLGPGTDTLMASWSSGCQDRHVPFLLCLASFSRLTDAPYLLSSFTLH